jgi:hypothetical protein
MEKITSCFIVINGLATIAIALCAYANYWLSKKIMCNDKQHKEEISDLYRAIVISNLFCAGDSTHTKKETFRSLYNGKTKIF